MGDIRSLADLIPDPRNARRHTSRNVGMIEKALNEVGAARSIVVDENGVVLAGNATIEAAAAAGIERVQVVEADGQTIIAVRRSNLSPEQKAHLALFDNRAAELAEWDMDVLAGLGQDLDLSAFWTKDELAALIVEDAAPGGGDDYEADVPEEPTTKPGDVWRLGRHVVACLDSTDEAFVRRVLRDEKPAMVWADPPYGIDIVSANEPVGGGAEYDIPFGGRTPKRLGSIGGAKPFGKVGTISRGMKATPIIERGLYPPVIGDDSTETAIRGFEVCRKVCPGAVHIWWGANHYANALPSSSCWIVWDKDNGDSFFADAELAWCSDKSAVRIFKHMWNGLMKQSERGIRRVHPTQKPVALAAWAFEKYGSDGDVILDPFLGSGISIIAAERTGRRVVGFELSPAYVDVCIDRWQRESGLVAERID